MTSEPQPGDLVYRTLTTVDGHELLVLGRTVTAESFESYEKSLGATPGEFAHAKKYFREQTVRGFLYGQWYSTAAPTGDWGWVHKNTCVTLNEDLWLAFMKTIQLRAKLRQAS